MVTEDPRRLVAPFIDTSLEMIRRLQPFVRALVTQPGREDIVPEVTDSGFRLLNLIKGSGIALGFHHLTMPATAMEYLLDQVRSGILPLTPSRITLLAEVCTFLERGLILVREEHSDAGLADGAAKLASAIRLEAFPAQDVFLGDGSNSKLPEDAQEAFFWETSKLVTMVEQEFVLWDFVSLDPERVIELSRVMNRLRQCFALYDFHDPEWICQAIASTLSRFARGECFQTAYPERIFLRCIDAIRTALVGFPSTNCLLVADVDRHLAALQGLMRQPIGELLVEAGLVDATAIDEALAVQRAAPAGQSRFLGEVLIDMGRVTSEQIGHALHEQYSKQALVREAEVVGDAGGCVPDAPVAVAVDDRRLEQMHLVLERLLALRPPDEYLTHLNELAEIVRICRRDALTSLNSRLQRVVHDLAAKHGKRVHFIVEGIGIFRETDETAGLLNSVCHLLRNSVEHGLETVVERRHAGKKTIGRLHLLALRQGEEIWISVEDDGRGFDDERVASLLVGHGVTTADAIESLNDQERIALLLKEPLRQPARGEDWKRGLIAVQKTVKEIGGAVHMVTRPGKGTCVTLRVPRRS